MIYTRENIDKLEELNLHDYELQAIDIDYFEKNIKLYVKDPQGKTNVAKTPKFYWLIVEAQEPWGEGNYIHEFKIIKAHSDINSENFKEGVFGIQILLNSGDKVIMYVNEFQFDEY